MAPGDLVYIWDPRSDLFILRAEILEVRNGKALVMVRDGLVTVADSFYVDDLRLARKAG